MTADDLTRCKACNGLGYFHCACWPGDCICGKDDETCWNCDGEGLVSPRYDDFEGDLPYQCDACSTPGYGPDAKCQCTPPPAQTQPVEAQGAPIGYVTGSNMRGLIDGVQGVMTVSNVQNALFQNPIYAASQPAVAVGEVEPEEEDVGSLKAWAETELYVNEISEENDRLRKAIEKMRPHVEKIAGAVRINDEWGRVVAGQTEAAKALADIFAALHGSEKGE